MPAVRQASLAEGEGVLSDRLGGWGAIGAAWSVVTGGGVLDFTKGHDDIIYIYMYTISISISISACMYACMHVM